MSTIPSEEECLRILREEGTRPVVIRHCCTVKEVAVRIAERCDADLDLVKAGALLHDIGRSRTHGVGHAVEGARIARERKLSPGLVKVIQRHLGAGLTGEEAEGLGFPPGKYMPETLEERIVTHADNLVGDRKVRMMEEAAKDFETRGFPEAARRMREMHAELSRSCGEDIDELLLPLRKRVKLTGPCAGDASR